MYDLLGLTFSILPNCISTREIEETNDSYIERREKWPKKSWEEGEIGGKSREEGEKQKLGVGRIELDGPG